MPCDSRSCASVMKSDLVKEVHFCPISSISFFRDSLSRLDGKDKRRLIRRSRIVKASRKARSICSCEPSTAAGSGIPQCTVMGCPGHIGHTSFAALSQTVITKSKCGASGFTNSSQLLLRKPVVGSLAFSICRSAVGWILPLGWLPALKAVKFGEPLLLRIASAMMDRAEFPVQRNRTL
jgi:hypothetical protein